MAYPNSDLDSLCGEGVLADEIGELAKSFDALLERINANLERVCGEATAASQKALESAEDVLEQASQQILAFRQLCKDIDTVDARVEQLEQVSFIVGELHQVVRRLEKNV